MVWQEHANIIVMLTALKTNEGKEKCARYWPADSETLSYGPFIVNAHRVQATRTITVTELHVTNTDDPDIDVRKVYHIHVGHHGRMGQCSPSMTEGCRTAEWGSVYRA